LDDYQDESKLSEEEKKKRFDAKVKEIMRQKMKEKGFDMDDSGDLKENETEAERKKKIRRKGERDYAKEITC